LDLTFVQNNSEKIQNSSVSASLLQQHFILKMPKKQINDHGKDRHQSKSGRSDTDKRDGGGAFA
jgi:hypothetical protein